MKPLWKWVDFERKRVSLKQILLHTDKEDNCFFLKSCLSCKSIIIPLKNMQQIQNEIRPEAVISLDSQWPKMMVQVKIKLKCLQTGFLIMWFKTYSDVFIIPTKQLYSMNYLSSINFLKHFDKQKYSHYHIYFQIKSRGPIIGFNQTEYCARSST